MKYTITPDRRQLILECTPEERETLRSLYEDQEKSFGPYSEAEALERLIANSELDWISPEETGDLTSAPMLGILGEEGIKEHTVFAENHGLRETGKDGHWTMAQPILERWAFMDYQVRSFLEDLMNHGKATFTS